MRMAVIPARGGSKRIPRKNIKLFSGVPILGFSIRAAIASECFDRIVVSTDDDEIADIAKQYGAEVPFIRPSELSDDYAGTTEVVSHAVDWQDSAGVHATEVCCIYATAPFLQAADIRHGLDVLITSRADFAFSVTSYAFPVQRAMWVTEDGRVDMFQPENFSKRSQDLVEAFHDAAQFYWGTSQAWRKRLPIFSHSASPVMIPRFRVQDIDTPEDWERAEWMFKALQLQGSSPDE